MLIKNTITISIKSFKNSGIAFKKQIHKLVQFIPHYIVGFIMNFTLVIQTKSYKLFRWCQVYAPLITI